MTIDSFDIVFYTAIFILPGFIINAIIDTTNPPKRHNDGIFFLKCLTFSIIHCAVWSWLYKIIIHYDFNHFTLYWISLVAATLLGSTLIAICIAFIKQKGLINKTFHKLGIKSIHSTPTAWDYKFSKQEYDFVIITLLDDTKIKGLYYTKSFASSDSEERDLYIEKLYYDDEEKEWNEDEENNGVYIPKNQIKFIEFKRGNENE